MTNYQGRYFEQVFNALTAVMANESTSKEAREIRYFSEMPEAGKAPTPLTPDQVQSRLISGRSVVAHSETIGYVPFGFISQDELAYGNDLIDKAVPIPDAPQKPGFFWSGFLDIFGYKTEAQQSYEQALGKRNEVLAHSAEREALRKRRSELTDIEQKFRSVENNEKSAEVERILSENDKRELARLRAHRLGHDKDNLDIYSENRKNLKNANNPEELSFLDEELKDAERVAREKAIIQNEVRLDAIHDNHSLVSKLVEVDSDLHMLATGRPLNPDSPISSRKAFAALTSNEINISGLNKTERQTLVENMDIWLGENRKKLKSELATLNMDVHKAAETSRALDALTGRELVKRLEAMQISKIARYESRLPLKDWPDHRPDNAVQMTYRPYPEETPKSQKGQELIELRRKEAYEVLSDEKAKPDAVSKAMATVMVIALFGKKSPEAAEAMVLAEHELKVMPKDAPRRERISQLVHEGAERSLHARTQFSPEHPEEFDKAVDSICKQPGFLNFLADKAAFQRSRAMLSTHYMLSKFQKNGESAQLDLAREEQLALSAVSGKDPQRQTTHPYHKKTIQPKEKTVTSSVKLPG